MASQLERMCRLADIRPIGWHVARHSFASHLVMRGVPIRAVQELMGHASIVITQRYAHLAPHVSQDAVRLLDGPRAAPSARSADVESMPEMPAHAGGIVQGPTRERSREKSRRIPRKRPAVEGVVAKNRQETRPEPLLS